MIRCVAIDDEPLALELLEDNISKVPFLQLIAACDNVKDAMKVMQQETVDLIFLDIQMPGLTGLQFIESMTEKPIIILITAYKQYALEGYNLDVLDYLVKPVSLDRFIKACNKANQLFELRSGRKSGISSAKPEYIFVNADYKLIKVTLADIIYIEGLKDYIKIHLKSAQHPLVTRMPIKAIEEQLPPEQFIRIHKSYIISVSFITAIRKSSVFMDSLELPLGDTYRDAVSALTGNL
ncbi:MAG TPA: LytTR family DNA-binding domain-containing protein [Hanamia sp.]|nr:LytTR family DNA-binding domain-containing protein [Hanamia sp.]